MRSGDLKRRIVSGGVLIEREWPMTLTHDLDSFCLFRWLKQSSYEGIQGRSDLEGTGRKWVGRANVF